jgi:hypothetical protein
MKIDLNAIDQTQFMVHQHIMDGQVVHLVQPQHIGCSWCQDNKHLRSSVWDYEGNLISAGFPKFTNWGEKPDHFPVPNSLKNCTVVEKLDGSLLIVSKWKGNYIIRTRGTVDATKLDNGHELELFKQNILPLFGDTWLKEETWKNSFLFEWVSPNQRIILNYGDSPDWYFVGVVNHDHYSLWPQADLDVFASACGFKRPVVYTFPTVADLVSAVEMWKGKEGVCIYSNRDQTIHKVKALEYLVKHRFKSEASLENTLNLYFEMGQPAYSEFEQQLVAMFDYECFEMVRGFASSICDAAKEVRKIVEGMDKFVEETLKPLPNRRLQAEKVLAAYSTTSRASFVFVRLDGKPLNDEQLKKLFWQVLKK